jgi:hypothetical protein
MRDDVSEAIVCARVVDDGNHVRSAGPEWSQPPAVSPDSLRHVAIHVPDEGRELRRIARRQQHVHVIREVDEGVQHDVRVERETASKHAEHEVSFDLARSEQEALLHRSRRDLVDDFREIPAKRMTHSRIESTPRAIA